MKHDRLRLINDVPSIWKTSKAAYSAESYAGTGKLRNPPLV